MCRSSQEIRELLQEAIVDDSSFRNDLLSFKKNLIRGHLHSGEKQRKNLLRQIVHKYLLNRVNFADNYSLFSDFDKNNNNLYLDETNGEEMYVPSSCNSLYLNSLYSKQYEDAYGQLQPGYDDIVVHEHDVINTLMDILHSPNELEQIS